MPSQGLPVSGVWRRLDPMSILGLFDGGVVGLPKPDNAANAMKM